jgi:hypothetical protein
MNLWGEVVDSRAKVETNLIQPTHIYRLPNWDDSIFKSFS